MSINLNDYQYLRANTTSGTNTEGAQNTNGVNKAPAQNNTDVDLIEMLNLIASDEGWNALYDKLQELKTEGTIKQLRTKENEDGTMSAKFSYNGKTYEISCPKDNEFNQNEFDRLQAKGWNAIYARVTELKENGVISELRGPIVSDNNIQVKFKVVKTGETVTLKCPLPEQNYFKKQSQITSYLTSNEFVYSVLATGAIKNMPNPEQFTKIAKTITEKHANDWWSVTPEQILNDFIAEIMTSSMKPATETGNANEDPLKGLTENIKTEYENGKPSKETVTVTDKQGNVVYTIVTTYSYYKSGEVDSILSTKYDAEGKWISLTDTWFQTNGDYLVTEINNGDNHTKQSTYSADGTLYECIEREFDKNRCCVKVEVNTYSEDGTITNTYKSYIDGDNVIYENYDQNHQLTYKEIYNLTNKTCTEERYYNDGTLRAILFTTYNEMSNISSYSGVNVRCSYIISKSVYNYDTQGRETYSYVGDPESHTAKEERTTYNADGSKSVQTRNLDKNGNLAEEINTDYNPDGQITHSITKDGNGNLISESEYTYKDNGEMATVKTIYYNEDGSIKSMETTIQHVPKKK